MSIINWAVAASLFEGKMMDQLIKKTQISSKDSETSVSMCGCDCACEYVCLLANEGTTAKWLSPHVITKHARST